jgi:hypothetical protein
MWAILTASLSIRQSLTLSQEHRAVSLCKPDTFALTNIRDVDRTLTIEKELIEIIDCMSTGKLKS